VRDGGKELLETRERFPLTLGEKRSSRGRTVRSAVKQTEWKWVERLVFYREMGENQSRFPEYIPRSGGPRPTSTGVSGGSVESKEEATNVEVRSVGDVSFGSGVATAGYGGGFRA